MMLGRQQRWTVTLADGTKLGTHFASRDEALACEVRDLQNHLEEGR